MECHALVSLVTENYGDTWQRRTSCYLVAVNQSSIVTNINFTQSQVSHQWGRHFVVTWKRILDMMKEEVWYI